MDRYTGEWQNQGLQIYAISPDSIETVNQAKNENKITFDLISEPSGNAAQIVGFSDRSAPAEGFAVVDKDGNVLYKLSTFDFIHEIPKNLRKFGIVR